MKDGFGNGENWISKTNYRLWQRQLSCWTHEIPLENVERSPANADNSNIRRLNT